ncbi:MAG: cell division protein FtsI (penicillin-binding protein 3) [Gammaproteobacteria bacterium]|jgi:cell division protein FtsI (penicillin-binding protein 3)
MSEPNNQSVFFGGRHYFVLFVLLCLMTGLVGRALYLQIVEKEFLASQGGQRQIRTIETPAYRGAILDRYGTPLAISTPVDSVWVNPTEILQNLPALKKVTKQLSMNYSETVDTLKRKANKEFVYLKRQIEPELASQVSDNVDGVYIQREYHRYYPAGEVVAHIVGFTDIDDNGIEGLEKVYDNWLKAESGARRVIRNRKGAVIEEINQVKAAQSGKDIYSSIDMRLQYIAYRSLARAIKYHAAKSGSAVLLDARTGEVLAMVNQPSYNPNQGKQQTSGNRRNRALTDVFEPGSSIKPFTFAAAIDRGLYDQKSIIDTSPGWFTVSGHTIKDHRNYGPLDLAGILRKSSNVGASRIALSMKDEELWKSFSDYGFGQSPGVIFPGESSGYFRHFSDWQKLDHAIMGYGYGVSVSITQLARAYAMIANQGQHVDVSLIRKEPEEEVKNQVERHVMTAKTANMVLEMMEEVVGPKGTAQLAAIPGYRIGGKTGTTKKASVGGYDEDNYFSVFAGVAPISDPRLVMAVIVDEPTQNGYYGGNVAAPVFQEVMSNALRILNVTPDDIPSLRAQIADTEKGA